MKKRPQKFDPKNEYDVVIYVRMSSKGQNPRSPDQQINEIKSTIRRLGLPWKVVKIYRDDCISGRLTRRRPELMQMRQDLRSGAVRAQLVLVDTFERLSRAEGAAELRKDLERAGAIVLTADSQFADPTTAGGKMLSSIEAHRATEEGRIKGHNVRRGKRDAARRKRWTGGPAPFGYRLKKVIEPRSGNAEASYSVPEPDDQTAPIVRQIFELAAARAWGGIRICRYLDSQQDIPEALKPFKPSTIDSILKNPLYYGRLVWGQCSVEIVDDVRVKYANPDEEHEVIDDYCEPIVTYELWRQAEQHRQARKRSTAAPQDSGDSAPAEVAGLRAPGVALRYPLSGLVVCDHCGKAMVANSGRPYVTAAGQERRYVRYVCVDSHTGACSNKTTVSEDWLRQVVMELLRTRLFPPASPA